MDATKVPGALIDASVVMLVGTDDSFTLFERGDLNADDLRAIANHFRP